MKDKEKLRNHPRMKETKEPRQLQTIPEFELDSEQKKDRKDGGMSKVVDHSPRKRTLVGQLTKFLLNNFVSTIISCSGNGAVVISNSNTCTSWVKSIWEFSYIFFATF
jgi:hypothetical protein